jgi:GntR family transcriptional regulator
VIRRTFHASGEPAVYSVDFVPRGLLPEDIAGIDGLDSIFDFLRHYAKRQVRYSVADIVPVIPPPEVVEKLGVPGDRALVLLHHIHIDESDRPVAVTKAYINDHVLRFSVVRTYTNS